MGHEWLHADPLSRTPSGYIETGHYVNRDESYQDRGHGVLKALLVCSSER